MRLKLSLLAAASIAALTIPAFAGDDPGPIGVAVGYDQGGVHPGIWLGTKNVDFVGTVGTKTDAGAIKIHNQTPFTVTITKIGVEIGKMQKGDIWLQALPIGLAPGHQAILTQTAIGNFDTSDMRSCTASKPVINVALMVGSQSVVHSFLDENQVLCSTKEGTAHWAKAEQIR